MAFITQEFLEVATESWLMGFKPTTTELYIHFYVIIIIIIIIIIIVIII